MYKQIINHLRKYLPRHTTLFSTTQAIETISAVGNLVSIKATAHTAVTNEYLNVKNVKIPYTINSLTQQNGIATAITTDNNQVNIDNKKITIQGATETDYNGEMITTNPPLMKITNLTKSGDIITATTKEKHGFVVNTDFTINVWGVNQAIYNKEKIKITSVIDDLNFTYTIKGNTTSPATTNSIMYCQANFTNKVFFYKILNTAPVVATGTIQQMQLFSDGYNGFYKVNVIDVDNFTYEMNYTGLLQPSATGGTIEFAGNIDGKVVTKENVEDLLTSIRKESWIILSPQDTNPSKSSRNNTDSTMNYTGGTDYTQTELNNFELYIILPSFNTLLGLEDLEKAREIKYLIFKSLVGVSFTNGYNNAKTDGVVFDGDGTELYINAFYVHRVSFQVSSEITNEDIFEDSDTFNLNTIIGTIINADTNSRDLVANYTKSV